MERMCGDGGGGAVLDDAADERYGEGGGREMQIGARGVTGERWGVEGALWLNVAWLIKPAATCGLIASMRRPSAGVGWPLKAERVGHQSPESEPDDAIWRQLNT